ncbi:hypothetical protein GCM10027271_34440 [Saccharopolyspora gloriosae]|uniref:Uncharacterized protein n=1 Tax=Saccharopolyspora gloriosae TaxID=455344 RepID=A0A840NDJ5_9PSEU|nr:hypothetical protein [Saccharopolyspora gloriosae]MBB5069664.1 hypothetical protein [Saccharopolyspora gloriosae]
MQRGSDKHGPAQDDALEADVRGMLQGNHPTRAQEELDAEPPADDDPAVLQSPAPEDDENA